MPGRLHAVAAVIRSTRRGLDRLRLVHGFSAKRLRGGARLATVGIVVAALAGLGPAQAQQREVKLASGVWPPFTDVPGQSRFAIDLVHEALERVGVTPTTTILGDFGEVTPGLKDGRFIRWFLSC